MQRSTAEPRIKFMEEKGTHLRWRDRAHVRGAMERNKKKKERKKETRRRGDRSVKLLVARVKVRLRSVRDAEFANSRAEPARPLLETSFETRMLRCRRKGKKREREREKGKGGAREPLVKNSKSALTPVVARKARRGEERHNEISFKFAERM